MFVKELNLKNYYMFHDSKIEFSTPKNGENIVNIIIGANGTGKTKLLNLIKSRISQYANYNIISVLNVSGVNTSGGDQYYDINNNDLSSSISEYKSENSKMYFVPSQLVHIGISAQSNINDIINKPVIEINQNFANNVLTLISRSVKSRVLISKEADPAKRMQTEIDWFNSYFKDTNIKSKLFGIENLSDEPIFTDINKNSKFTFNELSSGEKQIYSKIAIILLLQPKDSLILIDEPELSRHPEWQATFIEILKRIGSNNQFILATHSPYIVSNITPEDHLIVLKFDENKQIQVEYDPKFMERDINTTLESIMGYSHVVPEGVMQLRKEYRSFFDQHKENTLEAISKKNELLQYETPESSFFQEIELLKALRND